MATSLSNAATIWSPGTASVLIKDRIAGRRTPRDFHADAIPRDAKPSNAIMTNTTAAINALCASTATPEFERGTYWINGSISFCGRDFSSSHEGKQVYFNDTTFRAGGVIGDYRKVTGQEGEADLSGLDNTSDNLPAGEDVRVLVDMTNCLYYNFTGKVNIHGGDLARIAGIATSPGTTSGLGAQGWCGDTWIISNCKYGAFGTPRYSGNRTYYAGLMVGTQLKRLRTINCTYHLLMGGNMIDDAFIGELNSIYGAGETSLIYGAALCVGTYYSNGVSSGTKPVGLDIQDTNFHCGTFYAEEEFEYPLVVREKSWVTILGAKYGAGANTDIDSKTMVHFIGKTGGGIIHAHQRTGEAVDDNPNPPEALVSLSPETTGAGGDKRNITVYQQYEESVLPPFKMYGAVGASVSRTANLISVTPDGMKGWKIAANGLSVAVNSTIYNPA